MNFAVSNVKAVSASMTRVVDVDSEAVVTGQCTLKLLMTLVEQLNIKDKMSESQNHSMSSSSQYVTDVKDEDAAAAAAVDTPGADNTG